MKHSLYVHIPFCSHRCVYCDFNTYAGKEALIPEYTAALCREIEHVGAVAPSDVTIHTIYIGGGTPSLLPVYELESILCTARRSLILETNAEITLEANPGSAIAEAVPALRRLGINRLSIGVQSANDEELRMLGRQHDFIDVLKAVSAARQAGFDNINLDIIYGLPGQSVQTWRETAWRAIELNPEHISAYALTIETGTPFGKLLTQGLLSSPDPDVSAEMYDWLNDELSNAGYIHYEISNWAREGADCRHNLQYWRGLPYLGIGAGSHGYAGGFRYSNVLQIRTYIDRQCRPLTGGENLARDLHIKTVHSTTGWRRFPFSPAVSQYHRQTLEEDISEYMIMGLRLTQEGINSSNFNKRFGRPLRELYQRELDYLLQTGLVECVEEELTDNISTSLEKGRNTENYRLTERGCQVGNQVFMQFLP
jgi:oxygen-independent coproporphyrinogen-3 oxidase